MLGARAHLFELKAYAHAACEDSWPSLMRNLKKGLSLPMQPIGLAQIHLTFKEMSLYQNK